MPADRRWTASLLLPRSAGTILRLAATLPDEQGVLLVQEMKNMARAYLDNLVAQDR